LLFVVQFVHVPWLPHAVFVLPVTHWPLAGSQQPAAQVTPLQLGTQTPALQTVPLGQSPVVAQPQVRLIQA